jgi:hypothetical protein
MSQQFRISDYSRYFSQKQKVCLINRSAEHNSEIYESMSGIVISSRMNELELMITHAGHGTGLDAVGKATYTLTSESLGSGFQVQADLIGVVDALLQFRLHGTLEMFQRRNAPRIALATKVFQLRGTFPLAFFRKEWHRVLEYLRNDGDLPGLDLQEMAINLSVGGIGLSVAADAPPTPLSIFFIALDEGVPVCTLAERVWEKNVGERVSCGLRYISILKADQERINRRVLASAGDFFR